LGKLLRPAFVVVSRASAAAAGYCTLLLDYLVCFFFSRLKRTFQKLYATPARRINGVSIEVYLLKVQRDIVLEMLDSDCLVDEPWRHRPRHDTLLDLLGISTSPIGASATYTNLSLLPNN
jgi:hypothetical protein